MKPTWVQKNTDAAKNINTEWGIITKSVPFNPFPDLKEVFKRDWPDVSGDQEYLPPIPKFKAYEIDVSFVYIGGFNTAGDKIRQFCEYIVGPEFSFYDEYTGNGFRCRFVSYNNNAFYRRDEDLVEFSLKLKINNPLSYVVLSNGSLSKTANAKMSIYWSDGTKNDYTASQQISKTIAGFGIVSSTVIARI